MDWLMRFAVRYPQPNSVPQSCIDELRTAIEKAEVIVPVYQLLQEFGKTGIVFRPSESEGLDMIDDGTELLVITIGADIMHGVEVPLVDYVTHVLPLYCRAILEPLELDNQMDLLSMEPETPP